MAFDAFHVTFESGIDSPSMDSTDPDDVHRFQRRREHNRVSRLLERRINCSYGKQVYTMTCIREHINVAVPGIFVFNTIVDNPVGTPVHVHGVYYTWRHYYLPL